MPHTTEELIQNYKRSKLSQKEFCIQNSIPYSTLQYHLKKNRNRQLPLRNSFIPMMPTTAKVASGTLLIYTKELSIAELSQLFQAILK